MEVPMKIPTTAEQWQLYDRPGAEVAAEECTAALKGAFKRIGERLKGEPDLDIAKVALKAFQTEVYPVLQKHSKYGATDTEPRNLALCKIEQYITRQYGFFGNLDW